MTGDALSFDGLLGPTLTLFSRYQTNRWDANWMTQMFEKGYGLETRQGGWRYHKTREDKKDVDEETTLQAIVKGLEKIVTKEQVWICSF